MNFANLEKSDRLKRVVRLMEDGLEHSTMEIIEKARVCAVNSIISELRKNGYRIMAERKKGIWYYQWGE